MLLHCCLFTHEGQSSTLPMLITTGCNTALGDIASDVNCAPGGAASSSDIAALTSIALDCAAGIAEVV